MSPHLICQLLGISTVSNSSWLQAMSFRKSPLPSFTDAAKRSTAVVISYTGKLYPFSANTEMGEGMGGGASSPFIFGGSHPDL
jgi:hypothetical protein